MTDLPTPIERAIKLAGSEEKLAERIGYSQVAVNKAKRRGHPSAEMAVKIERALDGAVTRSDLRPDLWPRIVECGDGVS